MALDHEKMSWKEFHLNFERHLLLFLLTRILLSETKRTVFSEIARIFVLIGWLAPVIVRAKVFMQSLWAVKLGWDRFLPSHYVKTWLKFRAELSELVSLTIPRWVGLSSEVSCELHPLPDASEKAIGAVVYLRVKLITRETNVTLVIEKTKVARKGETSNPRLKLCAALLLVRVVAHIRSVLNLSSSVPSYLLSDSAKTLDWIKSHPLRWMTYISNRVSEIQRTLPDAIWRHVSGIDNPADCASRGIAPSRLQDHRIWWQGPSWLAQSSETWPNSKENIDPAINREERKIVLSTVIEHEPPWPLLTKYSSLIKLLRVTALCLQFLARVRKKCIDKPPCHLTSTMLDLALRRLFGYTQRENYAEEIRKVQKRLSPGNGSPLTKLLPILDEDGLLRLEGRFSHAVLDYDERCPYILLKDFLLITLVIRNGHQFMIHGGPQLTLSYLRRRY